MMPLNATDENNILINLRENFDKKLDLSKIALPRCSEKLPQIFDNSRLCSFEISLH